MASFLRAKKYFTKKELDDYVKKFMTSSEITLMEQRERILTLSKENDDLKKQLNKKKQDKKETREKSKEVQELEQETKIRCAHELLSVKDFANKWYTALTDLQEKYNFSDEDKIEKCIIETDAYSKQYTTIQQSPEANQGIETRFKNILARVQAKRKEEAEEKKVTEDDGEFSINEALNPTDSLDDILKDLLK